MASFVVVDANVIDQEKLAQYSLQAKETLEVYGGRFIAKGKPQLLHGDSGYSSKSIIEFPDRQSAIDWYHSEAYQALTELREQGIRSTFQLL